MGPLVFDTFPYNGDEILPYRIEYLYPYVDYFVIVESLETFSGHRKDRYYIDSALPSLWKYIDKIVIVKQDTLPPRPESWTFSSNNNPDDWWRERIQRDLCKPSIKELANGPFFAIVGDVDEFPHAEALFANGPDPIYQYSTIPLFMYMDFFYYNFTWKKRDKWGQTFIKNDQGFFDEYLSQHKVFGDRSHNILNGWHFSFFMSREKIREKINSIGHTEYNQDEFKTDEWISHCLITGRDIFDRGPHEDCMISDVHLPPQWEKFQRFLQVIQNG